MHNQSARRGTMTIKGQPTYRAVPDLRWVQRNNKYILQQLFRSTAEFTDCYWQDVPVALETHTRSKP
jgi:hypothetical protein